MCLLVRSWCYRTFCTGSTGPLILTVHLCTRMQSGHLQPHRHSSLWPNVSELCPHACRMFALSCSAEAMQRLPGSRSARRHFPLHVSLETSKASATTGIQYATFAAQLLEKRKLAQFVPRLRAGRGSVLEYHDSGIHSLAKVRIEHLVSATCHTTLMLASAIGVITGSRRILTRSSFKSATPDGAGTWCGHCKLAAQNPVRSDQLFGLLWSIFQILQGARRQNLNRQPSR